MSLESPALRSVLIRKGLKVAVSFVMVALMLEFFSRLGLAILGYSSDYPSEYGRSLSSLGLNHSSWAPVRLPHPYWGLQYLPSRKAPPINNFGFVSHSEYPIPRSPDRFVIGIFGGSLAMDLALFLEKNQEWQEQFRRSHPKAQNREIVIANLAIEAGKQPQQFHVFAYFLPMLDLAFNIDGFNELEDSYLPHRPLGYPNNFPASFATSSATHLIAGVGGGLKSLREWAPGAIRENAPFNRSGFIFLTWKVADLLLSGVIARLKEVYAGHRVAGLDRESLERYGAARLDPASVRDDRYTVAVIQNWLRYARLQEQVGCLNRLPTYFFLQPNQYVLGSKPFTSEERIKYLNDKRKLGLTGEISLDRKYTLARKAIQGSSIVDLTGLFKGETSEVYRDNCCHLNGKGLALLAQAVLRALRTGSLACARSSIR